MTLQDIIAQCVKLNAISMQKWPVADQEKWVLARIAKVVEELGEFSEAVLTKMGFQRKAKDAKFPNVDEQIADEWADVFGMLMLTALDLKIDIPSALDRKFTRTFAKLDEIATQGKTS